jgi:large subunit ribosomal protein L13
MSTTFVNENDTDRQWFEVSADDQVLGRLAVRIATVLMGKHKPSYAPHQDHGDYVVVTNAENVVLSGRKETDKVHYHYTGYRGGLKSQTAGEMREKNPEKMIKLAVKRMLPKNTLGRHMLDKLKVYAGAAHPHSAQKPAALP